MNRIVADDILALGATVNEVGLESLPEELDLGTYPKTKVNHRPYYLTISSPTPAGDERRTADGG